MDERATLTLLTTLDALIASVPGADELTVRVSQYDFPGGVQTPVQYQAIMKFANRGRAWGVCVTDSPGAALLGAIRAAEALCTPKHVTPPSAPAPAVPRQRTRTRA